MNDQTERDEIQTAVAVAQSGGGVFLTDEIGYWSLGERALSRFGPDDMEKAGTVELDDANMPHRRFAAPGPSLERVTENARAIDGGSTVIATLGTDGVMTVLTREMNDAAREYFGMEARQGGQS